MNVSPNIRNRKEYTHRQMFRRASSAEISDERHVLGETTGSVIRDRN